MMNRQLHNRLTALEGAASRSDEFIIASTPIQWPDHEVEERVRTLAAEQGVSGSYEVLALPTYRDDGEILHVGNLSQLLKEIAGQGARICDERNDR